jgi:hypothetical protein
MLGILNPASGFEDGVVKLSFIREPITPSKIKIKKTATT